MAITSTGTWTQTYTPAAGEYTITHQGGPADGTTLTVTGLPPQTRHYATARARARRRVTLHRYTRHAPIAVNHLTYLYSGTDERTGPVPGSKDSPAWS